MIQANELRIGNYISYKNERWIKVGYHEIRYAVLYPDTSYYPIPLTPKILKKAGFEKRTYSNDFFIVCGKESKKTNGLFIEISIDDNYSCSIGQLKNFSHQFGEYKSLHQLQNLYFALTGEELDVNLKGMGKNLSEEEINNVNSNLNYLLKKVIVT